MPDPNESPASGLGAAMDALPDLDDFQAAQETSGTEPAADDAAKEQDAAPAPEPPAAPSGDEWMARFNETRDISVVPEPLRPRFEDMLRRWEHGLTQMGRERAEAARLKAEYERKLETAAGPKPAVEEEQPPPLDRSSEEAFEKSLQRQQKWYADYAVRKAEEKLASAQNATKEQMAQMAQQADDARRTAWIKSQPTFSPAVEAKILELGSSSPYWARAYWDDEGLAHLYEKAVSLVGEKQAALVNKEAATKEAQRRAGAPARTLDSPRKPGVSRGAVEAEPYAHAKGKGIDVMIDAIGSDTDFKWP